jgi:hypothetical protein
MLANYNTQRVLSLQRCHDRHLTCSMKLGGWLLPIWPVHARHARYRFEQFRGHGFAVPLITGLFTNRSSPSLEFTWQCEMPG